MVIPVRHTQSGATFVEATLSALLTLVFVFSIIDFSRYFFTCAVLNYAAFKGAELASSLELETNTNTVACAGSNAQKCEDYLNRVQAVLDETTKFAKLVASPSNIPSMCQLVPFIHYSSSLYPDSGLARTITADAGFLRPGEALLLPDSSKVSHNTRPYGNNPSEGWPNRGESWAKLLSDNPLEVVLEVEFKPITPSIAPMKIRVSQLSSRRTSGSGVNLPNL